jgi:hypothetical protein
MGKTSVSLAVVESPLIKERFPGDNCVWVPCSKATSLPHFLETLYIQLQAPGDEEVTLENIISKLDASKHPRLILFDNFETPWNAPHGTQTQVSDILRKLSMLNHVAILITMRGGHPPCHNAIKWQSRRIGPIDEAACRRIFYDINPKSEDDPSDIDHLLAALGYMPSAVALMANHAKQGKSTAKKLLDMWSKFGSNIFPAHIQHEYNMNQSISLSVDSDLLRQNPDALFLLKILSLLPAGTTTEDLCRWAPALERSMIPSAIAALSNAALLVANKSNPLVLSVPPVVQSFMQQPGRIADNIREQIHSSCCQYVLDHACRYDDSTFSVKSKALADQDANIQSILFGTSAKHNTDLSDRTMKALIAFGWHRCDTQPDLGIAKRVVMAAQATQNMRHTASAVWCLGMTYHQLGDYRLSHNHLREAFQLFKALPPAEAGWLGVRCGIDLVGACKVLEDQGEMASRAEELEMKFAELSRNGWIL